MTDATTQSLVSTPTLRHTSLVLPDPGPLRRNSKLTSDSEPRRRRQRARPIQEGDPACWAWPAFNFPSDPEGDTALRAFYAWHKRRCGICGDVPSDLVVDHDHNTGLVRGLLCDPCNKNEGRAKDPRDVFARWRAVPSAAILGIEVVYRSPQAGRAVRMPFKVTGPVFMPDWAPVHYSWPPVSVRGPQPPARPLLATPEAPRSPQDADEWPMQVGDLVALGLRARPHGEAVCHVGKVTRLTKFGVQIDVGLYVEDGDGPELHTVPWPAIEEIRHGAGSLKSAGDVWEFSTRWRLGVKGYGKRLERLHARRQERELRQQGATVRGYL